MKVKVKLLSGVRLFATPRTIAYQAPPSVGSSRHESWSGLPFPSPGDLPYPGIEPGSPSLWADALPSEPHTFPCVCWGLSRCSHVRLFATLCTIGLRQGPLSMGFSKQEHWSGLPCPPPGSLPNPGIEPMSLMSHAHAFGYFTTSATWEALDSLRRLILHTGGELGSVFTPTLWREMLCLSHGPQALGQISRHSPGLGRDAIRAPRGCR